MSFITNLTLSGLCELNRCLLTSGSVCLGNSDVVKYLYRILMSSCSSPLLHVQSQKEIQLSTYIQSVKYKTCVAVYSLFKCELKKMLSRVTV